MEKMESLIASLDGYKDALGIGLGIPGPTDTVNGKIIISNNLPDLVGYPIADRIQKHFNKPTFMANDVKVAGLAEALLGEGKGKKNLYYLTISTGVAGAMILDGKVLSGFHGHGGEIGNAIIDPSREPINGLNPGAAESWYPVRLLYARQIKPAIKNLHMPEKSLKQPRAMKMPKLS